MFTLVGFGEDLDPAAAIVNVAALQDDHIFTSGDDLRIPQLNRLVGIFAGVAILGATLARLSSPSLREMNRILVRPLNHRADSDAEPSDPPAVMDMRSTPRILTVDEILQFEIDTNPAAAAFQWCLCLFADAAPVQVSGEVFTVHLDGGTTVTARAWSTVPLTFADTLPAGRYQVVGMRAVGASAIAARLVFKPGTWRPGCIASDAENTIDHPMFRFGAMGVWGEFEHVTPPDAEFLCDLADTAQDVELDLIKVS